MTGHPGGVQQKIVGGKQKVTAVTAKEGDGFFDMASSCFNYIVNFYGCSENIDS